MTRKPVIGSVVVGRGEPSLPCLVLGEDLVLDLPRMIETRVLIQAGSGAGKSWLLRRLLEQTHGAVQQIVIDVEGEFHTLREKFDYILAAPRGGDCLADVRSAALLARRLLELGVSAIISIFDLKPPDRIRFVKLFLESLIDAPRELWHPCIVAVDESDKFAPERGHGNRDVESTGAIVDLMARGRKRGLCGILASQRLSKLSKDAAAEAGNKLIGRCALDLDRKRAGDELGFSSAKQVLAIRDLEDGVFYAFGPAISKQIVEVKVGPVATTHPKVGQRALPPTPPRERVKKILDQLADLPKEAEEEAKTVEQLRTENRLLKRVLKARPTVEVPTTETKIERVEVRVPVLTKHDRAAIDRLGKALDKIDGSRAALAAAEKGVAEEAGALKVLLTGTVKHLVDGYGQATQGPYLMSPMAAGTPTGMIRMPAGTPPNGEGHKFLRVKKNDPVVLLSPGDEAAASSLSGPERRILDALAWLEAIGNPRPETTAVAFVAGYRAGGGAFNNPKGRLRGLGLVEYPAPGQLELTAEGRAHANYPDIAPTNEALHIAVLDRLDGPERRIMAPLLVRYPEPIANEALAAAAGYEAGGGAFNNPKGRLRSLGLVEYPAPGLVKARDILFPEGAS